MSHLDNLEMIWKTGHPVLPTANEMMDVISRFRKKRLAKKRRTIALSILLLILMVLILTFTDFKMFSTYLGGALMGISYGILALSNLRSYRRFNELKDRSNLDFLNFLEQTHRNMLHFYHKSQVWIMALCTIGLTLYMLEAMRKNLLYGSILYGFSLAGLSFSWFYLRPKYFKKNLAALEAEKHRYQELIAQYHHNDKI